MDAPLPCPICGGTCALLGVVDFNRSCEEYRGRVLPPAGVPVSYFLCARCAFCFAPEFMRWRREDFERRIYNGEYAQIDPDYADARPRANAQVLLSLFGTRASGIRHLDYGGGAGLLSELLRGEGWQSSSYDPFAAGGAGAAPSGGFDLVTAFEVFEHVPDVRRLIAELASLLCADGIVLFSTLLSDGHLAAGRPLDWWYASPRNGHVSLFSTDSLVTLGASEGLTFGSFTENYHAYWKLVPAWARHLILGG